VPGGQAGLDYVAVPVAITPVFDVDGYQFGPTPGLTGDVQFWLENPGQNFGWMLICQQENLQFTARRYGSREAVPSFNVPRLLIDFDRVPEPGAASLFTGGALLVVGYRRLKTLPRTPRTPGDTEVASGSQRWPNRKHETAGRPTH
jgi:hypothetical protein